jgi:hypothetical protein
MEEKLLASLAGRKKANASRLLRRKESGGTRAAATKVDVDIGQGHKDASQKPADDVITLIETEKGGGILDSDHSSNNDNNVLHFHQDDDIDQAQEEGQPDKDDVILKESGEEMLEGHFHQDDDIDQAQEQVQPDKDDVILKELGEEMLEGDRSSIEANAADDRTSKALDFLAEIKQAGPETYCKFLEIKEASNMHEKEQCKSNSLDECIGQVLI